MSMCRRIRGFYSATDHENPLLPPFLRYPAVGCPDVRSILIRVTLSMSRWGDWNQKGREAWEESQRRYPDGINLYYLEYVRKFCCCACKREIRPMQGWYYQVSTGNSWHVECVTTEGGTHGRTRSN